MIMEGAKGDSAHEIRSALYYKDIDDDNNTKKVDSLDVVQYMKVIELN